MSGTKGRSGRKTTSKIRVVLTLRLQPGRDDDLIKFFGDIPPGRRPEAIKAALRGGNLADGLAAAQTTETEAEATILDSLGSRWDDL
jgi:hypothetical protein